MPAEILVPFGKNDSVEEMISRLESISPPGARVLFLVAYPFDNFEPLLSWLDVMEGGIGTRLALGKIAQKFGWEAQQRLAKESLTPAIEALEKRDVKASIELYTGPLKKILESHAGCGDVHLVVMKAGTYLAAARASYGPISLFWLFKRRAFSSTLVLRPAAGLRQPLPETHVVQGGENHA